jgi:hypothetical protein
MCRVVWHVRCATTRMLKAALLEQSRFNRIDIGYKKPSGQPHKPRHASLLLRVFLLTAMLNTDLNHLRETEHTPIASYIIRKR